MATTKIKLSSIIHWKDQWISGRSYKKHAVVFNDGSAFIAIKEAPATEPVATYAHGKWTISEGWALVAFGAGAENEKRLVDGHRVMGQAIAQLLGDTDTLKSQISEGGDFHAESIDCDSLPTVAGSAFHMVGAGAPAVAPRVPFSEYWDSENNKFYKAKGKLSNSVSDWVLLN